MLLTLQFNKMQLSRADELVSVTLMQNIPPATIPNRALLGTKDEGKFFVFWEWKR